MIVVAIIGVISAIAIPNYNTYMKKSRRADAKVGLYNGIKSYK
jgi:type IV pilus assembly protein PilE